MGDMDMDPTIEKPLLPYFISRLAQRLDFPLQSLRPKPHSKKRTYAVICTIFIFLFLYQSLVAGSLFQVSSLHNPSDVTDLSPVFNDTLGVRSDLFVVQPALRLIGLIVSIHLRARLT